jgi:hypothetical protein
VDQFRRHGRTNGRRHLLCDAAAVPGPAPRGRDQPAVVGQRRRSPGLPADGRDEDSLAVTRLINNRAIVKTDWIYAASVRRTLQCSTD